MTTPILCIYHKDCIDGTTAAAVVLRKFPDAHTFPLGHGCTEEEIEAIIATATLDSHIYIVDASFGAEYLLERGYSVTVLDHHISEHERMTTLQQKESTLTYIFDNTKSGASLTWTYFFPDEPLPQLILHVEDSDLWKQLYGRATEDVTNYLSIWRNNPEKVRTFFEKPVTEIQTYGSYISEYIAIEVAKYITKKPLILSIGQYSIQVYNITNHQSVCGHILSTQTNSAVGLYSIDGDSVRISFRSLPSHTPSALDLAHILGGGGHRDSSGARMPLQQFVAHIDSLEQK